MNFLLAKLVIEPKANIYIKQEEWNGNCKQFDGIAFPCSYSVKRTYPTSILAWKIPWMEEPGRLQSMGLLGVGDDWVTSLSLFTFMHWRRKWQPNQYSCLENPRDGGAWWAAVYGVAQSQTRLKQLSSSSIGPISTPVQPSTDPCSLGYPCIAQYQVL